MKLRRGAISRGYMRYFTNEAGATFSLARNSDTVAQFAKPVGEFLLFSLAIAGRAQVTVADGEEIEISPLSGITFIDGTRSVTTSSHGHAHISLVLPRASALDVDAVLPDRGVFTLANSGTSRILAAQIASFAREAELLDAQSAVIFCKPRARIRALSKRRS
ncbi:hypothetical protein [Pelagibacterium sp.]|uniref:hypothetical protein n=1 Tax=Pelagibacterium sp. TaxID=1967288 RepID=UPI003A8E1BD7